jgi:hypothetical protein
MKQTRCGINVSIINALIIIIIITIKCTRIYVYYIDISTGNGQKDGKGRGVHNLQQPTAQASIAQTLVFIWPFNKEIFDSQVTVQATVHNRNVIEV